MRSFNLLAGIIAAMAACGTALAQTPVYENVGRSPTDEEVRAWDISIGPEGKELPPGSGTAQEGANIYARRCAVCHGPTGTEAQWNSGRLVGGQGTLRDNLPTRTIGSFWPFATTIFDFVRRAMPQNEEGKLSADELYSLTAFLLFKNGIIKENEVLDAKSLPKVQMPNRNGFVPPVEDLRRWRCPGPSCP